MTITTPSPAEGSVPAGRHASRAGDSPPGSGARPFPHVPGVTHRFVDVRGARLHVAFEIDDRARGALVPPFLLQPLVENAVKHGIAPFARPGEVRVRAHVADSRLQIVVSDSGGGPAAMPNGSLPLVMPMLNSVTVPLGVIRPMRLPLE